MTMTFRQFKYYGFVALFFFWSQWTLAADYRIVAEYRRMDADWPLLPTVPASFQSASDLNVEVGIDFGRFGLTIGRSNLDLELLRSVEPKDVSLSAKKDAFSVFYKLSDQQKLTLSASRQSADEQRFECYDFTGITIGSCEGSDIQIGSTNSKYDVLDGDLVAIRAGTKTVGISFSQISDFKWLDHFSVGLFSTSHNYSWLTPVEDLNSPFILGLVFNGKTLDDAIAETFRKFPQQDVWRLNQVNISGSKAIPVYGEIKVFAQADVVYLKHSNYNAVVFIPNYNVKVKVGLRFEREPVLVEVYANYYHHNLIGFDPITFNQRTEHYFDRPYGYVGARVEFRF